MFTIYIIISVVVTTSACHVGGKGSIPGTGSCDIKTWLSILGTVYTCESENHVNVGPVSIWDVKEPMRTTIKHPGSDHPQ